MSDDPSQAPKHWALAQFEFTTARLPDLLQKHGPEGFSAALLDLAAAWEAEHPANHPDGPEEPARARRSRG